ncbi:MAG: RNA methyltransferase [Planctomycetota bacterium]
MSPAATGRAAERPFERVGVVLLRPRSPGNVGSVARAMKNMGFGRLVLASAATYDDPGYFDAEARRMAWRAADLLERRQVAPDLDAALAPFSLVVGTSSRPGAGARVLTPREAAALVASRLAAEPSESAAFLFGREDSGLTREDLARCHVIGSIRSARAYPSLNLSHAVLVFLYEARLALLGDAPEQTRRPAPAPLPARGQVEAFYGRLERALEEIGFFRGTARASMMRDLRLLLNRAFLTQRELAIFEGLVHRILGAARRRG